MDGSLGLRRWMSVVGAIYVLMGVRFLPWINGAMITAGLGDVAAPGIELESGTVFFDFAVDWMGVFGLDLLVLGGILLYAARNDPSRHRMLVLLVLWQEAIRGVLADIWMIGQPYASTAFYLAFIVFHLVVIGTGIRALRASDRVEAGV